MRRIVVVLLVVSLVFIGVAAQEKRDSTHTPDDLERMLEESTQDAEDSQLLELLHALEQDPLDPNTATPEELQQLPGVTSLIALAIVRTRELAPFERIEDLLSVEGMTQELLTRFRRFLRVGASVTRKGGTGLAAIRFRSRVTQDLQQRRGFTEGTYPGSQQKVYHRLVVRSTDLGSSQGVSSNERRTRSWLEAGIIIERDAGEKSLSDFIAGYLSLNVQPWGSRIILGDYVVEAGEGLVFWRSTGFSKGSEVISTIQKNGGGIKPYASTDENSFLRGVAAETRVGGVRVSAFVSHKRLHASVNDEGTITSFNTSGLFRTPGEMQNKNASGERMVGGIVSAVPVPGLKFELSGYRTAFNHPVRLTGTFGFLGTTASVLGLNASWTGSRSTVFSEIARDHGGVMAGVAGVVVKPARIVDLSMIGRIYPRNFISLHSFGFGEGGGATQNESGLYFGVKVRPLRGTMISSYYDQFVVPWRTSLVRLPSEGNDLLTLVQSQLTRKLSLTLQFKRKNKAVTENVPDQFDEETRRVGMRKQLNYRATLEVNSSVNFRWRSRVEWVQVAYNLTGLRERGILAYQDIRTYAFPRFLLNLRIIAFHTDSFDSRVYEFESDTPGALNNPGLFGRGYRWYATARYEVSPSLNLWLKYGHTVKEGLKVISSGSNQILGNLDNRVSLQLDAVL
ncbi:MAG: helix-hairpin-helix domain-containing protein [Bacteroidota bacterium]